ncbi:uncharacterized protein [Arachis hypogaea]|uniref:uncharacterized protein n=1 Tax=Arachis hypogaea TaxID=3818 RepID=UPI003B20B6EC
MTHSLPDPSLATFDPEIERTLFHIRQALRRLAFGDGEWVSTNSPTLSEVESEAPFKDGTIYSSIDTTNTPSIDLGTDTMTAPRRVTLKEANAPNYVLQPLQVRHPDLNTNFELKTALINLLAKFHRLPAQDPIRHLRDFQGVCSTTRRESSDEDLIEREFLDKFFAPEVTDRLRKEISCIVQGELETLYEYWEHFRKLLDSSPHHMIDTLVLISYFCQGMKPQDKILLDASSNGSLTKTGYQQNPPYRAPHQRQAQAPQPNQLQAPQITYPPSSSNQNETLYFILQGQKELQNSLNSSLTGLTSTLQALISRVDPPFTSNNQPSSSSALPSQPLSNPKGGINAITLRSGTKLQERSLEEPSPREVTQDDDIVEVEEVEEEDEVQEVVEREVAQLKDGVPKDGNVVEEATPIPFPMLARKTKKQVEQDPKMVEIFKKVEVTIPLFDAIHQVPKYAKFLKYLCMSKEMIHDLETIPLGSSISALMGAIPEKCGDPSPCLVTCTIDGVQFLDCMCDLGACVNIMPLSV